MAGRGAVVAALVLAAAATAAGAWWVLRSGLPDLGPSPPHRDLVPRDVAYFAEAKDVERLWRKMRTTESWKDLAGSRLAAALREEPSVKDLLAAVEQAAARLDYPIDGERAMRFIGRETSFAVRFSAAGDPAAVLLARLDVDALTEDLLARRAGWRELMEELTRRSGKLDFQAVTEVHATPRGEVSVARLERGGRTAFLALCGDTLVLSTDRGLCGAVIDLFAADGAGGLGSDPRFRDEAAKFAQPPELLEWFDLDQVRARRAAIGDLLRGRGAGPAVVGAVDGALAGLGGGGVARATRLPEGDLYGLRWRWSKGPEMFADAASPALGDLLRGDWMITGQSRGLGRVVEAWDRSALRRKLAGGKLGEQIDAWFSDPETIAGVLDDVVDEFAPGPEFAEEEFTDEEMEAEEETDSEESGPAEMEEGEETGETDEPGDETEDGGEDGDEDEPTGTVEIVRGGDPLRRHAKFVDRFAWRMAASLARAQCDAVFAGDAAFALDWAGAPDAEPRIAVALRLDVDGRLAALAIERMLADRQPEQVDTTTHGGREIRTWTDDTPGSLVCHWTRIGDVLFLTNDLDTARRAIDGAAGATPPGERSRAATVEAALRPGWWTFFHLDVERFLSAISRLGEEDAELRSLAGMTAAVRDIDSLPLHIGVATWVAEDLSRLEFQGMGEMAPLRAGSLVSPARDADPSWRTWLPATTFLYAGGGRAFGDVWEGTLAGMEAGGADRSALSRGFRDATGMDLFREVRPSFGDDGVLAFTYRPAILRPAPAPGAEAEPPLGIPGCVVAIGVRDEGTVRRLLDRGVDLLHESIREREPGRGDVIVKQPMDGLDVRCLQLEPHEAASFPLRPALALGEGWLVLASDVDVLRGAIDVRRGRAPGVGSTPAFARAAAVLTAPVFEERYLDGNLLLDEIREMVPMVLDVLPSESSPAFPEFPEDGDEAEWERRLALYREEVAKSRGGRTEEARSWIEALRVLESASWGLHREGTVVRLAGSVEFVR